MSRSAELDAALARAYGLVLDTAAWLPGDDAEPDALLRAAEVIGHAIGDRRPGAPQGDERAWTPLPVRAMTPPSPDERRAAIARALAWAHAGGARWDGIEFPVDADGNASVRASRALSPGEEILRIPRRLMIVDSELGLATARPRDTLAAWLPLEARAPASRWRAYLDALPVQLPELPMFHDERDLAALAGTAAHAIVAEDHRDVLDTYAELSPALRARVSLADYAWGCAIVKSRGFHAPGTVEHRLALLPVVDYFNHRLGDTTWSFDPLDGHFVITTERAFAIGDAVHFPYGERSNTRLLAQFGFVEPGNPIGEAGLVFEPAGDPVTDVAAHLLWRLPLATAVRLNVACVLDHRFLRALSLARLHAAGPGERTRALELGLGPHGDMPWLGAAHEDAALAVMARAAQRALAELDARPRPTADRPWDRSCAIVRDDERAVLEHMIELTHSAREHLHGRHPAIPDDATGAPRLLRQYLRALADE